MFQFKKKQALYITHRAELLIWLMVVLIIVAFSSVSFIHKSKNDENDYQVFLPDVDGLIVGSPVRMMGVQVGHVIKIKPVKDEVYVKFILTNPDISIPQGSEVTVEFSGMAGSKSLELYLPEKGAYISENTPIFTINPPKRLHDAIHLLDNMYKKIGSIIYSCSSFGNKLNENDLTLDNISDDKADMTEFLKFSDKFLDNSKEKAKEIRTNLEVLKNNAK
mgnify:CR=1 FL=1